MVRGRSNSGVEIAAWLLKCNPRVWDIEGCRAAGHSEIGGWRLAETYRNELMEVGDRAVLWVTGNRRAQITPGVWALGAVAGRPSYDTGDEYWLDAIEGDRPRPYVRLSMTLLEVPIAREALETVEAFASAEVLRQPQMGNPSILTLAEIRVIDALVS